MTSNLLIYIVSLFCVLFICGTVLSLSLYKWNLAVFFKSSLWTKIAFWIPLFIGLVMTLLYQEPLTIVLACILIGFALYEFFRQKRKTILTICYLACVCLALGHIALPYVLFDIELATRLFVVVCFSSVLSDVCAYFFGNFFGKHKLPAFINARKSWEGVIGQFVGAFVGFLVVLPIINASIPFILALLIGLASATGDIFNSIVKRQISIKDWAQTIPGHGGVLDRFSSLGFAVAASVWFVATIY